jgi:hypothetical protein
VGAGSSKIVAVYQAIEHDIPEDHSHHDYFLNYRHAVKYY